MAAQAPSDERSTVDIVKDVTANAQTILRKELELARIELQTGIQQQVKAIALFAVAGVVGLFVLGFAGVTAAVALQEVLQPWAAWLIVTGAFTLVALLAVVMAKAMIGRASLSPEQTKRSIEENVAWAKTQLRR